MTDTKLVTDKVALVTGAGRGVGADIAKMLAAHGAKVIVNDLGGSADGGSAFGGSGLLPRRRQRPQKLKKMVDGRCQRLSTVN